jgi:hypothetical protein
VAWLAWCFLFLFCVFVVTTSDSLQTENDTIVTGASRPRLDASPDRDSDLKIEVRMREPIAT